MASKLFITRNLPPLVGGMERLALEAITALATETPVSVIGPRGCTPWVPGQVVEVSHTSAAGFISASWWAGRRLAAAQAPCWVVGGSGLAAPAVVAAASRAGARSACFVHGLDLVVNSAPYRALCLPALRRMDLVIANSHNTARLAAAVGVDVGRVQVLHPGVAAGVPEAGDAFMTGYPVATGRPLLMFVGRLLPRKGVAAFVRNVMPKVVAQHPDVLMVVAGGAAGDALTGAGGESARLNDAIADARLSGHVLCTGQLDDEMLHSLYAAATLMVFPVRDVPGDVEGFGMVALEAAAHGLPTLAFAAGGVPDAVADGISGHLVQPGDYAAMVRRIHRYLSGDQDGVTAAGCRAFAGRFAWSEFGERLRGLLGSD